MTESAYRPARLLLHACCGPCLLEPLDALAAEADDVAVAFANSNIHPAEEYDRRKGVLLDYAGSLGVEVTELPYDAQRWHAEVGPLRDAGAERCRACYRLRLSEVATYAAQNGFDAIATTLSVSPYQHHDAIRDEGRRAAAAAGVRWVDRDFRDRYPDATRRSRELGMYRQNYCGCVYSQAEAQAQREARKAARATEKAARAAGNEAGEA